MTFYVRITFEHDGERLWEMVGPFDRFHAELVCISYADTEYLYGLTWHRVLSARIVPAEMAA